MPLIQGKPLPTTGATTRVTGGFNWDALWNYMPWIIVILVVALVAIKAKQEGITFRNALSRLDTYLGRRKRRKIVDYVTP